MKPLTDYYLSRLSQEPDGAYSKRMNDQAIQLGGRELVLKRKEDESTKAHLKRIDSATKFGLHHPFTKGTYPLQGANPSSSVMNRD